MPILAVDQFGRIYETSPDREDGLGFGQRPECVSQGDLTLGAAYLKSQAVRQRELIQLKRDQRAMDAEDATTRAIAQRSFEARVKRDRAEARMLENPVMREALTRKALAMGCDCEYSTPMSGNVMTANGQSGWRGMSRDAQMIHHAVTGEGVNTAYQVDPEEELQHRQRVEAERLLRLKARR
jgi:hypothetical protein